MIVVRNAMLGPPGLLQILQIAFPVTDYAERCYVQVMFEMGEGGNTAAPGQRRFTTVHRMRQNLHLSHASPIFENLT